MAGDWIKMREDLHEDPAVLWMAQQLGVRPETIVGFCHRFWGLVSRQTCDGCLRGPTLASLGSVLGLSGFPELLVQVGWLDYDTSNPEWPVVNIPKYERHLSEGAKARLLAAERQRLSRVKSPQKYPENVTPGALHPSRIERDKSVTREEKRREENKKNPLKEREVAPPAQPSSSPSGDGTLALILARWNQLPAGLAPRAETDPPAKAVLKAFARLNREPELRRCFADLDALFAAIEDAEFCHGAGWFRLPWIFATGKTGEWNARKLLDGAYRGNGSGNGSVATLPLKASEIIAAGEAADRKTREGR